MLVLQKKVIRYRLLVELEIHTGSQASHILE